MTWGNLKKKKIIKKYKIKFICLLLFKKIKFDNPLRMQIHQIIYYIYYVFKTN